MEEQVCVIWAGTNGYLDPLPLNKVKAWEKQFLTFTKAQFPQVGDSIRTSKALSKDMEADLKRAIEQFSKEFKG
jgi:F-type H+-transporting ATPase subunit alpha